MKLAVEKSYPRKIVVVLNALKDADETNYGTVEMSQATLAERTGLPMRTLQRTLKRMERFGFVRETIGARSNRRIRFHRTPLKELCDTPPVGSHTPPSDTPPIVDTPPTEVAGYDRESIHTPPTGPLYINNKTLLESNISRVAAYETDVSCSAKQVDENKTVDVVDDGGSESVTSDDPYSDFQDEEEDGSAGDVVDRSQDVRSGETRTKMMTLDDAKAMFAEGAETELFRKVRWDRYMRNFDMEALLSEAKRWNRTQGEELDDLQITFILDVAMQHPYTDEELKAKWAADAAADAA